MEVYKKLKIRVVLLCLLIIFASSFILIKSKSSKQGKPLSEDLANYVEQYDSLINEITNVLRQNGFEFVLDYAILPNKQIEILIKLSSKDVEQAIKEDLEQTVITVLKENNSDPALFLLNISSYHETPQENDRYSVRLSYNDLMGYIMHELQSKNHSTFSLEYKVASENVELTINVPVDSNPNTQKEVEQIALGVIEKHQFDIEEFQITVINEIRTN